MRRIKRRLRTPGMRGGQSSTTLRPRIIQKMTAVRQRYQTNCRSGELPVSTAQVQSTLWNIFSDRIRTCMMPWSALIPAARASAGAEPWTFPLGRWGQISQGYWRQMIPDQRTHIIPGQCPQIISGQLTHIIPGHQAHMTGPSSVASHCAPEDGIRCLFPAVFPWEAIPIRLYMP